jgi:hypothetical protein
MAAQGLPKLRRFPRINEASPTQRFLSELTHVFNPTYSSITLLDDPSHGLCTTSPTYGSTTIHISGYFPNDSQADRGKRLSWSGHVGNGSCWSGKFRPFRLVYLARTQLSPQDPPSSAPAAKSALTTCVGRRRLDRRLTRQDCRTIYLPGVGQCILRGTARMPYDYLGLCVLLSALVMKGCTQSQSDC